MKRAIAPAPSNTRIFRAEQPAFVAGGREVERRAAEGLTFTMRVIMCTGGYKVLMVPPMGRGGLPYYLEK